MNIKEILRPTLVLLLICVIVTAALSGTNLLTKDAIFAQEQKVVNDSMKNLIPDCEYTDLDGQQIAYSAQKDNVLQGYIFITQALGYKSNIKVMSAFSPDGTILGVSVIDCADESAGIGQKVGTDTAFLSQFKGYADKIQIIDAITGATYSCEGVKDAVNNARDLFQETITGGQAQ